MTSLLTQIVQTLKNPLVSISMVLGFIGAGALWYSGKFSMVQGQEWVGGLLFIAWVIISSLDALVTLTVLLRGKNGD